MSIEKQITELIEALKANTEALQEIAKSSVTPNAAVATPELANVKAEVEPDKPKRTRRTKKQIAEEKAKEEEEPEEEQAEDENSDGGKKFTIKDVRAVARPLIKDNRSDEVAEILEDFGAESISDLEQKHYGKVINAIKKLG